jgi:hypothetical protein
LLKNGFTYRDIVAMDYEELDWWMEQVNGYIRSQNEAAEESANTA